MCFLSLDRLEIKLGTGLVESAMISPAEAVVLLLGYVAFLIALALR